MTGLDLIRAEVERRGSIQAVAAELDYSRSAISLALAGRYPGSTERLEARAVERLGRVHCPHQERDISITECRRLRRAPMQTSSRAAFRQWQACRLCPNNPDREEGPDDTRS